MVAGTGSAVLIHGETGTGKELVAKAIHEQSLRRRGPYVRVNCAAIPAGLLESELFGHERGAFTGALTQTCGRFQLAHTGTLFLDEIGDLPLELQPKLLRVLQEQEFERLGSTRTIRVDVRIVAATNQDLPQMVRERRFRADLFYRLNVFPIDLPPLRARTEDIPLLVDHFIHKLALRMNREVWEVSKEVMEILQRHYDWPGNIRELQNVIERAVIMSPGTELLLPPAELKGLITKDSPQALRTLVEAERAHILETLRQVNWVVAGRNGAASRLGVARTTLISRMNKLGINPEKVRTIDIPASRNSVFGKSTMADSAHSDEVTGVGPGVSAFRRSDTASSVSVPIALETASNRTLADAERVHITAILQETNGVVGGPRGAAAQLGVPRTTLIARMQRLGISNGTVRSRSVQPTRGLVGVSEGVSYGPGKDAADGLHVTEMAASLANF
jgi:formate hydrogenlyase transcriptional activator